MNAFKCRICGKSKTLKEHHYVYSVMDTYSACQTCAKKMKKEGGCLVTYLKLSKKEY